MKKLLLSLLLISIMHGTTFSNYTQTKQSLDQPSLIQQSKNIVNQCINFVQTAAYNALNIMHHVTTPQFYQNAQMQKTYQAKPCTNQKLLDTFNEIQKELDLYFQIPLFITDKVPAGLPQNTAAFYSPEFRTVTILNKNFQNFPEIVQRQTLYHELKHHLQYSSPERCRFAKEVQHMFDTQQLTHAQALEYDADLFGAIKATNNCPTCLQELQKNFEKQKPQDYKGYATQQEFKPLIQEAKQQQSFCQKHNSKLKRASSWVKNIQYI